jgi:hypothetical protein
MMINDREKDQVRLSPSKMMNEFIFLPFRYLCSFLIVLVYICTRKNGLASRFPLRELLIDKDR